MRLSQLGKGLTFERHEYIHGEYGYQLYVKAYVLKEVDDNQLRLAWLTHG